jgi:epoxide hydrolase
MSDAVEPFLVNVDEVVLDDLRDRLARTRFAQQVDGSSWDAGMPGDYLRELVAYWRDDYDWRAEEARLNQLNQYRTTIDDQTIHFVHARSPHADAMPLLLTHGWPGSFVEFQEVIPKLVDPTAHGGRAEDAFHVVAPSLPGYAFSGPTKSPGWDVLRIARAFTVLMDRLGYDRYGAQGGDWGAQVTTRIPLLDPEHCIAIHLNMALGSRPAEPGPLTEEEQADLASMALFQRKEAAYAAEQGTKPNTVGAALDDSPVGLLAWIVEKFRTWSDCDGDPESCFTRDQLLTNVTVYWVTGTATSAARLYFESNRSGVLSAELPFITVPTGVARYPKEVLGWPRAWVERQYHVTSWTTMPRGGHFAAMEQPELFAEDLRAFFRTVR